MRRPAPSLAFLLLATPALAQQPLQVKTEKANLVVETVARGLEHPWSLAFLPDGRMLVTERPGRLRMVSAKGELSQPLAGLPKIFARGQGGLLDVLLDPNFAGNRMIYLSFAEDRGNGRAGTSVARAKIHLGKIVRIKPAGGAADDNPRKPGWAAEIWSIGHRNVQGAALNPATGEL